MTAAAERSALAELLPGLANDVNTPAQYVADNVSFLRRAFDKLMPLIEAHSALANAVRNGDVTPALLQAVDSARAAARLDYLQRQVPRAVEQSLYGLGQISASMRALKELSRTSQRGPEPTDLHELIEAVTTLTKNEWLYIAELRLEFDWSLPSLPVLREELSRLLQGALLHAARCISAALPPGSAEKGKLVISTRLVDNQAELRLVGGGSSWQLQLPLAPSSL